MSDQERYFGDKKTDGNAMETGQNTTISIHVDAIFTTPSNVELWSQSVALNCFRFVTQPWKLDDEGSPPKWCISSMIYSQRLELLDSNEKKKEEISRGFRGHAPRKISKVKTKICAI